VKTESILRRMILTERRRLYVLNADLGQATLHALDVEKALRGEEPAWLAGLEASMPPMPERTEAAFVAAAGVLRGRYYPEMPPAFPGETDDEYTDRLTGADQTDRRPYDHKRFRQCSIGYHKECTDPSGEYCKCPCHEAVHG
jgi:hypothetical protein